MATYKKMFKTVVFTLHGDDDPVSVQDTTTAMAASAALAQFMNGDTIKVVGENNVVYIPFHAVVKAIVTEAEQSITKGEDDFCQPTCDC